MIEGPLRDPLAFGWPQSVPVDGDFRLPDLVPRSRLHVGLLIALAVAVGLADPRAPSSGQRRARPAERAGRGLLCGRVAATHDHGRGGAVGRPCGPCGRHRGHGRDGACHDRPVARFRLFRHRGGDARGTAPNGRGGAAVFVATVFVGADAMSRATGVPVLHRRRDRGAGASDDARGASLHQLPGAAMTEARSAFHRQPLGGGPADRHAADLRRAGALLCERAGVLNLGIEGIMTMGAMVGWLTVFLGADLWTGLLIAALPGLCWGCCMRC
jgi:hypothetical protein